MLYKTVNSLLAVTMLGSLVWVLTGQSIYAEQPYSVAWSRQLTSSGYDIGASVAIDGIGNAYLGGSTYGSLFGPNAGSYDAFLAKYNSSGSLLWSNKSARRVLIIVNP